MEGGDKALRGYARIPGKAIPTQCGGSQSMRTPGLDMPLCLRSTRLTVGLRIAAIHASHELMPSLIGVMSELFVMLQLPSDARHTASIKQ